MSRARRADSKVDAKVFSKFVNAHDENILLRHQVKVPSPRNNPNTALSGDGGFDFAPI